jgi:putative ABC transport system permease protein
VTTPNVRYAVRSLAKSPIFSIVAVLSLGLALAVNTTVFALVDSVVHPTVPYHDAGRVYAVSVAAEPRKSSTWEERYAAIRGGFRSADVITSYYWTPASIQSGNSIEDAFVANVSPELFEILGVKAAVGRTFNASDSTATARPVVLISHELWLSWFKEQPLENHLTLRVGRGNYEIVGVLPRGMHYPGQDDVWLPPGKLVGDSGVRRLGPFPVVRVRNGVTPAMAASELTVVFDGLNAAVAPRSAAAPRLISFGARGRTLMSVAARRLTGGGFMILAVMTVLLIACANLGTMLLARGMARRREIAIRIALGASRRAIATQVLTECTIIVGAGITIGLVLMVWSMSLLPHYAVPYVPGIGDMDPSPSWRVFAFAATIAAVALMLGGALPAMRAAPTDPAEPMKDGAGATGRVRDRYNPLIVIEVALSTALLMTAGLFIIAVARLAGFDFSYAAKQLQVASLEVRTRDIPSDSAVETFYDDLAERMRALRGVRDAATSHAERPDGAIVFAEEGLDGEHWMNVESYKVVSPTYLSTLGIPIADGRDFQPGDRGTATGVVIVDDSAAHRLWPDLASPVGRMIKLGTRESRRPWLRVVGVARSVELLPRTDVDLPPAPEIYVVYGHDRERDRDLVVRGEAAGGADDQAMLGATIRRALEGAAPWMRTRRVHRWLEGYDGSRQGSAFFAALFTAFGGFGLVLCGVGLYGVIAYTVNRRVRELATRIALGAQARDVVRTVLHDVTVMVLAGIGVGAFVALTVTHGFADTLFNVRYELLVALVSAEAALFGVGVVACLGPLRQAIRADPVEILRAG